MKFQVTDGYQTREIDALSELDARMWFVEEFALPAEDHDYLEVQALAETPATAPLACLFCQKVKRGMHDGQHPTTGEAVKVCRACATRYGFEFGPAPEPARETEEQRAALIGECSHTIGAVLTNQRPAAGQPRLTSFGNTLQIAREMGFDVREVYAHRRS